jgi:hypothetical protein
MDRVIEAIIAGLLMSDLVNIVGFPLFDRVVEICTAGGPRHRGRRARPGRMDLKEARLMPNHRNRRSKA